MFHSVKAKNFLSWKDLSFTFEPGLSLIDGFNYDDGRSEGVGKSSVFESLCFGLFGKTSRNVKIDEVIHEGSDSCIVRVDFLDNSYIVRSRSPNDLYIVFNDRPDVFVRGKDSKETQKIIERHVGLTFETFCQAIYFPQNYNKKFITANEEERAKILSDIQNLTVYDKARKTVSDKLKEITELLKTKEFEVFNIKTQFNQYNEEKARIEELIKNFESQKNLKLYNIKNEINTIKEEKEQYESDMMQIASSVSKEEIDEIDNNVKKLEAQINELQFKQKDIKNSKALKYTLRQQIDYEIENREKHMKELAQPNGECPTCGSELNSENKLYYNHLKQVEEHINKINKNINNLIEQEKELQVFDDQTLDDKILELNNNLIYLQDQRKSFNAVLNKINDYQQKIKECDDRIQYKIDHYNSYQFEDCEDLKKMQNTIDLKVKEAGLALSKGESSLNIIKTEFNTFEMLKNGFREIKSYVFKGLLAELNKNANKTIFELFEQDVRLEYYNEGQEGEISKINVKIYIDGKERSIGLLSGGQFRRAQIATDLALSTLVYNRSNKLINLQIFDEAFKDLSETTVYKILELLQKQNRCTILIEHNSVIKNSIDKVYNVELKNGISKWA